MWRETVEGVGAAWGGNWKRGLVDQALNGEIAPEALRQSRGAGVV